MLDLDCSSRGRGDRGGYRIQWNRIELSRAALSAALLVTDQYRGTVLCFASTQTN